MKALVIDDQSEVLRQINKLLNSTVGPDGLVFQVTIISEPDEALSHLRNEYADVVITDMVMGVERTEGLTVINDILAELKDKSPITIVLTAHPSIPNCVASMRAGAWDYLEKMPADGSDPYDNLLKSLEGAYRFRKEHPEAGRYNPDTKWIHEHIGELMEKYPGEVVAVLDQQVVGHNKDYGPLSEEMQKNYPIARPVLISIPDPRRESI